VSENAEIYFWKVAWRNLRRHWKRNLSTGLAIGIGFAGIVLLGGYLLRMEAYLNTQTIYLNHVGHLAIYKKGGLDRFLSQPERYGLSADDQTKIVAAVKQLPQNVDFVSKSLLGQGLVSNGCQALPFLALAVESSMESKIRRHPQVVKNLPELAQVKRGHGFWENEKLSDGILLSHALAARLDKKVLAGEPEEAVQLNDSVVTCSDFASRAQIAKHSGLQLVGASFSNGIAAADVRLTGLFSTGLTLSEDTALQMDLTAAQKFYDTDSITSLSVYLENGNRWRTRQATHHLIDYFQTQNLPFEVYPFYDERVSPYYVGAMNFVYVMTLFFLILVCGVAALAILNSLQISFVERRSEVGTLRAMGYRPKRVLGLFIREVTWLTCLSLCVGGAAAALVSTLINHLGLRFYVPGLAGSLPFVLRPGLFFSFAIAIIFLMVCLTAVLIAGNRWKKIPVVSLLETK
jgi:putative ABC transport system permease protein